MRAKKICVLAYLSMALTVGAVYATWNYATGSITPVTIDNIGVGITSATVTSKGTLKVSSTDAHLTIENGGTYNPVITWRDSYGNDLGNKAYISVGFMPNEGYVGTSISLKASLSYTGNTWTYGGSTNNIFVSTTSDIEFVLSWAPDGNASAGVDAFAGYYVMSLDISSMFVIVETSLDVTAEYNAYKEGLEVTYATITISDNT